MAAKSKAFDVEKIARDLLYVKKDGNGDVVSYGGWRRELLVDHSLSKSEEKLLICTLCKGVLRDALVVDVFDNKEPRCCVCLPPHHGFLNTHDIIRSVVNERKVRCPLVRDGCRWEGAISHLIPHLNECVLLPVPCPLGCLVGNEDCSSTIPNCVQKIRRNKLENHLLNTCPKRIIACEYCHSETEARKINSHLSTCEEFPIECHNGCTSNDGGPNGGKVYKDKRKHILDHIYTDCPLQEIVCPYAMYGCEAVVLRKDLERHKRNSVFMQQHLDMVEDRLKEVTTVERQHYATPLTSLSFDEINSNEFHAFSGIEWRVFDYKKKITHNFECRSPPFYSSGYKFRFYLTIVEAGCIGFFFEVLEGENDCKLLWPLTCELTLKLVNKSGNKDLVHEFKSDKFHDQRAFDRPRPKTSNVPFGCELISIADIKAKRFSLDGSLLVRFFVKCI